MYSFPVGIWGLVTKTPEKEPTLTAVRIDALEGGSFLILTREGGSEFDSWVESEADVEGYLRSMVVQWPDSGTLPTTSTRS